MEARAAARLTVLYTGGLIMAFLGAGFFLTRKRPDLGCLLPFAVGCALLLYGAGGMFRALRARRWRAVPGTVLSSELREVFVPGKGGGTVKYVPAVRTQYSTDTGTRVTDRFSLARGDFRGNQSKTQELLAAYPVGALVDVYVNPADPEQACLRPVPSATRRSQYLAAIVAGCLVAAIGLWMRAHR